MPLKAIVEYKAVISFLRNITRLKDNQENNIEDESRYLYPSEYDQENRDAEEFLKLKYENDSNKLYHSVAHQLFGYYNGRIKLKENRLTDYNFYTTSLDTYPFFAKYLVEVSKELLDEEQRLNYLLAHLDESFSFDGNLEEKFSKISDIHIHLGAALDFHYRISEVLKDPYYYDSIDNHFEPQEHSLDKAKKLFNKDLFILMSLFESAVIAYYLKVEKDSEAMLLEVWKLLQSLFENNKSKLVLDNELIDMLERLPSIRHDNFLIEYLDNEENFIDRGLLLNAINHFNINDTDTYNPKIGDKIVITYLSKKMLTKNKNKQVYNMIESYFIMRNIFKSSMFQQHRRSGFGYFASYSRNKVKKETQPNLMHIFQSIFHPEISTNVEVRIGVHNEATQLHKWFKLLHRTIININQKTNIKEMKIKHNTKIIFHFLKREEQEINMVRYAKSREKYQQKTYILNQFLTEQEIRYCEDDNGDIIDLAYEYFHGIDAASNELHILPEAFAPTYNFFKSSVISSGFAIAINRCQILPKSIDLQYSFHVGEEFRDIVSGVRAIFEAIIFLNLKDEDRLGHAVALGIEPKIFLDDREHITLTKGEYMDNLIFLYYIYSMSENPPYSLEEIRSIIEQLGNDIYGEVSNRIERSFTIDDYIAAWLLRRNCPLQIEKLIEGIGDDIDSVITKKDIKDLEIAWLLKQYIDKNPNFFDTYTNDSFEYSYTKSALPDFICNPDEDNEPLKRYLSIRNNQKAYVLYWAYASKKINEYDTFYNGNIIFPLDVYEYLQDFVMENYVSKRDLIIEVLPTSNLLITSIRNYEQHPFLRFNSPTEIEPNKFNIRTKKIKIALGTDDPGIQGSSLMMEYHILNNIISKRYSKKIAEDYLMELSNFGNYLFNKGRKS